jgi:hypothetical protein
VSITVEWDDLQKTIVRHVYGATWEWDEYLASFQQIAALAGEVDYRIGVLAETAAIKKIPPNAIFFGSRAIRHLPPNVVLYVVVSPSPLTIAIVRAIRSITKFNLEIALSDDEARSMIEAARTHSPDDH